MDIPKVSKSKKKAGSKVLVAVAVVAVALFTAWQFSRPMASHVVAADAVVTAKVERGDVPLEIKGYGELIPAKQRLLTAPAAAVVEEILLKPGQRVEPGDIILKLANPDLEQEVTNAELAQSQSRAKAKQLEASQANELLQQMSRLESLKGDLEISRLEFEANEELAKKKIVSRLELAKSKMQVKKLEQQISFEKARLEKLRDLQGQARLVQQDLLKQGNTKVTLLKRRFDSMNVKAGISGVIQHLNVELGQSVAVGTELALVGSDRELLASLKVPQRRADQISLGDAAVIDTRRGVVQGKVSRIVPVVDQGSITVEVTLSGKLPRNARPSLVVEGTISSGVLKNVLYVKRPYQAQDSGLDGLYRLDKEDDSAELVSVRYGVETDRFIEVNKGLDEGDVVIISDTQRWKDSDVQRLYIR
ncbi:HlyD family efflux transporter periplasmic adaptor subunit [Gallaecimonas kandeliae]|uniref:efflux RND transporter periplasmic adaptor subunit n=1 Tax=Gallaecimonas kandeliae TaxID=3029055 RepID=UPI002649DFA3|nr:HlyD family efflux transporter periplasmic adaptor subunit [Gallaecimonas kandeliae]WKE65630.1 HlyD family efflux transporter periplasmic adaptor subunit [Gallaecimonas kandeliae]